MKNWYNPAMTMNQRAKDLLWELKTDICWSAGEKVCLENYNAKQSMKSNTKETCNTEKDTVLIFVIIKPFLFKTSINHVV